MRLAAALLAASLGLCGCGYTVGGKGDLLPATLHTIAIPAFANGTTRYRLTEWLPAAIGREFLSRTRYRVVAEPDAAEAVLQGTVLNVMSAPTIMDQKTGRAAGIQVIVTLKLKLTERATGKVLFEREYLEVRQRYEVAVDQTQYFDESDEALQRLSGEAARRVVSAVLEAF